MKKTILLAGMMLAVVCAQAQLTVAQQVISQQEL